MLAGSLLRGALVIALAVSSLTGTQAQTSANDWAGRLLIRHNLERGLKGAQPLRWSPALAQEAEVWAERLANENRFEHSDHSTRRGAGENLWMGSMGYYDADQMMDTFLDERRLYRPGAFPQVSITGQWEDVGHYTQIIWPQTEEVGCAVAHNQAFDILVCRYWPAGNTVGVRIN